MVCQLYFRNYIQRRTVKHRGDMKYRVRREGTEWREEGRREEKEQGGEGREGVGGEQREAGWRG
jgi:hypothetical protein